MIVANPVRRRWKDIEIENGYPYMWEDGKSHIKIIFDTQLVCGIPLTPLTWQERVSNPDTPSPEFISCPKCIAHGRSKS